MMTLVCGGAASGKSAYAEALVCGIQSPSEDRNLSGLLDSAHRFYIATMQPFGKEAEERIRKHRAMRADKGFDTLECFTAGTIRGLSLPPGAAVLLEDLVRILLLEKGKAIVHVMLEAIDIAGKALVTTHDVAAFLDEADFQKLALYVHPGPDGGWVMDGVEEDGAVHDENA